MGAQANAAPIIIKKKKSGGGDGHHGGAWKVAYADFVTAMMAFFMLMWLLNATTEQQRKGIADYFTPTIPINRVSGGGNGAFGGESIFSEDTLPQNGTGASSLRATIENQARGDSGSAEGEDESSPDPLEEIEAQLVARGGESMVMENAMEHVVTRLTDEGLVIELFDLDSASLFDIGTDRPTQLLRDLTTIIADTAKTITNPIAISGHVRAEPVVLANSPVWEMSTRRGTQMRLLLERANIDDKRIERVTGHADRKPVVFDPMSVRNNRLEVILLRENQIRP
ncbi:MAG: flagellar motor protein MotB [Pseudomonadota bacterium]